MRVSGHIRSIFLASLHLAVGQPILGETCHISIKVQLHLDGRGPTTTCPRPVQAWEGWLVVRLPPPILGPSRSYVVDISLTTTHQVEYLSLPLMLPADRQCVPETATRQTTDDHTSLLEIPHNISRSGKPQSFLKAVCFGDFKSR